MAAFMQITAPVGSLAPSRIGSYASSSVAAMPSGFGGATDSQVVLEGEGRSNTQMSVGATAAVAVAVMVAGRRIKRKNVRAPRRQKMNPDQELIDEIKDQATEAMTGVMDDVMEGLNESRTLDNGQRAMQEVVEDFVDDVQRNVPFEKLQELGVDIQKQKRETVLREDRVDHGFRVLEGAFLGGQNPLVSISSSLSFTVWKSIIREIAPQTTDGSYAMPPSSVRAPPGTAVPDIEDGGHAIYIGNACPWSQRIQLIAALRDMPKTHLDLVMMLDAPGKATRGGWAFDSYKDITDPVFDANDLKEVYDLAVGEILPMGLDEHWPGRWEPQPSVESMGDPLTGIGVKHQPLGQYYGRCTAPLMVDRRSKRGLSNDSGDIVRMLCKAKVRAVGAEKNEIDLVPAHLVDLIDETNEWTTELLGQGVYRAGFCTTQHAFDKAVDEVARGLDRAEGILLGSRFLCGDRITEADIMLLPCACRFDVVYASLFMRGAVGLWRERPSLTRWLHELWAIPGVRQTIDLTACQMSYYQTLFPMNPSQIVPTPSLQEMQRRSSTRIPMSWEHAKVLFY